MITILHVEDDPLFTTALEGAFEAFGFAGHFLTASTLRRAEAILADPPRRLDLIISDLELPDGTGLDVVRTVRSSPVQRLLPILILSAHNDAATISRAYAFGANSYISKAAGSRTMAQVVRTIYDHWLQDARLPGGVGPGRTNSVVARAMSMRSRMAQLYIGIAEQLGTDEGAFWMGFAQREGNLANLLMFLLNRVNDREAPGSVLNDLEAHQNETLRKLDELDGKLPATEDDAFRSLLALAAPTDTAAFARCVEFLFPVSPLAVTALLDEQATSFESAAMQIETHSRDPELREGASRLRAKATSLRSETAANAPQADSR